MKLGSIAMLAAMLAGTATAADAPSEVYKPTAAQIALADQLRMPPQPPGRNAYPLLWSFDYDLAPGQVDAAYEADRKKAAAWASEAYATFERTDHLPPFPHSAASMAAPFARVTREEYAALCGKETPSCLGHVRGHVADVRTILGKHAALLARVRSLASYDTWWNTMPADVALPMPRVQPALQFWTSAAALRVVDGDVVGGLDEACTAAGTFRRLRAHANTLVDAILAEAGARRGMHLVVEILAMAPAGVPVPQSCRDAVAAPTLADVDTRGMAAYEHQFLNRTSERSGMGGMDYAMVGFHAALASEATQRAMLDDAVLPDAVLAKVRRDLPAMQGVESPKEIREYLVSSLNGQVDREADYLSTIRIAGLALWLREHPSDKPLDARIAAAPAGSLAKRLTVACEGKCIEMSERWRPVQGKTWSVHE
ncbi:hypothetical protein KPL74_03275 [Bacillus sp. NP157]|nr:hypothetical protein KPL74_03275 [Bacillus sp. NP157]